MEKKKFEFVSDENFDTIVYQGNKITVTKQLSYSHRVALTDRFVTDYFFSSTDTNPISTSKYDLFGAELSLIIATLDFATNIDVRNKEFNFEDFMVTGLWEEIKKCIVNWNDFRSDLDRVVQDIKEQMTLEKSLGYVIEETIDKISFLIQQVSEKVTNEDVDKLREVAKEIADELSKSPVAAVLNDMNRGKGVVVPNKRNSKKVH